MPTTPNAPSGNSSTSMYGFPNPAPLAGRSQFSQSFASPGSPASSQNVDDSFTCQMRDRQARGKDPYQSGDGSDGGNLSGPLRRKTSLGSRVAKRQSPSSTTQSCS
ncbi:hypothetical protein B0I37DRAFT_153544 [Chaetomium sp. MPI-CAGE-AT-0009]|nr:hypothetical protein B0I37DRAFT_153544 [Chaetomium sp. MPI-CAGE-AT-0009]